MKKNILFVCSRNQWRSPTGESIYRNHPAVNVKSGGTNSSARRKINAGDIQWADIVFAMEKEHKIRLQSNFRELLVGKIIHVLDIPDEYRYLDEQLITVLRESVEPHL